MLPERFDILDVGPKIREAVIYLNEIPDTDTATTSEGHFPYCEVWPSKDGWMHIYTEDMRLLNLIGMIVKKYDFVKFNNFPNSHYFLSVNYPEHMEEHQSRTKLEKDLFAIACESRQPRIDKFWQEFTKEVKDYAISLG